ncbi:prephenate dehydratase [Granulicella rosea]|uniref:Prephenate dehydratase n=1 Tax=Granulicella rosea TaxID=474952 RepID=A0A239E3Q7_9BACT|nr:prephenate dehydratase [Granulicella rosea]SNS38602.1 prephenate dehydratase [Granulicella rosea]
MRRIAIQGELGSNSHMAALAMPGIAGGQIEIVGCALSAEVFERVIAGDVDAAVLPIENSLHGSVAEHYDLLLDHPIHIGRESLIHIRHNVIAMPGVSLADIRRVLSHPVALSQCRRWLAAHAPRIEAVPFYDTAGSVKHLMAQGLRDTAGVAPALAARQYGAEILVPDIQDHAENYTRFYLLERDTAPVPAHPDKVSIAFSVEHRPGTLMQALEEFRSAGLNLTRIESRPVHGSPWEYVFYVDARFESIPQLEGALEGLRRHTQQFKELGRYPAA